MTAGRIPLADFTRSTTKKAPRGPKCGVCLLLDVLDEEAAAEVEDLFRDRSLTLARVRDGVNGYHGIDLSYVQYANHIRGECNRRERYRP